MNSIGLAVSILAGCALGLWLLGHYPGGLDPQYGWVLLVLALASLLPALISSGSRRAVWSALLLAGILAGCGRTLLIHPPPTPSDLAFYNSNLSASGSTVTITGVISAEPRLADRSQTLRITARSIKLSNRASAMQVSGEMLAIVPRYPAYTLGEVLTLSGRLTAPPSFSGFDYAAYLARQGVYSYSSFPKVTSLGRSNSDDGWLAALLAEARANARHTLQSTIAEPQASIAIGVVTGDRTSMSDQAKDAFLRSGTTHILATSGQNVSLLVGLAWLFYSGGKRQQRMPTWLAISLLLFVVTYTAFTGASPSTVRAAIMGGVLLFGPVVGRRYDPTAALSVSAALMVALDPDLLADPGFQLSFGAMLGIVFVAPLIQFRIPTPLVVQMLLLPVRVSLGATSTTIPLSGLITGQISIVGPLATLTGDFALLPLMISGILTAIFGVVPGLAAIPGIFAWLSSWLLLTNAQLWSSLPFAVVTVEEINIAYVVLYYAVLALAVSILSNKRLRTSIFGYRPGIGVGAGSLGIGLLAVIAIAVWMVALVLLLR